MNAYVEPTAMAWFQKTGQWPDGSQIVKEMSAIQVGNHCNRTIRVSTKSIGDGILEANYVGLGMMVKDAKRFPEAPGNWGFPISAISRRVTTAPQLWPQRSNVSPAT